MKTYLLILFMLISFSAFTQQGSLSQSVYRSRVNDSTTVVGATSSGYGYFFWNNQKAVPSWQFWNGTSLVDWNPSTSGGGSQDFQSVMDEGGTANIGNAQASLTAEDASNYSQWNVTPSTFEIANSNLANTAGSTLSVDTDGAHVNDTRANRGLQGGADYSANIQANDYTQKVYVDAKVANTITNGVTTIAPGQDAVFDALALKLDATATTIGAQDLYIGSVAMWPRVTNGCASLAQTEMSTSLFNVQSLDFDQTTQEFAQMQFVMPRNWNNGTVTATVYWTAESGSGGVVWGISGGAYSNDDALTVALGTAQTVSDTFITANDLHITSTSSAITLAGTPADADFIAIQISRNPADGSDTLNADAKLLGIRIVFTLDAGTSE